VEAGSLLDSLYKGLVAWLADPSVYRLIFPVFAAGSFLVALALLFEVLRKSSSLPRMTRTTGRIRKLEASSWYNKSGGRHGATAVDVEYRVNGQSYTCRTLYLFFGNSHVGSPPDTKASAGAECTVWYDPKRPALSALIVDTPRYASIVIAVMLAAIFSGLTLYR
jgi:hypothetical protein